MAGYSRERQALAAYEKSFEHLRAANQSAAIWTLNEAVSLLKLLVLEDGRLDLTRKLAVAMSNEASVQASSDSKLKRYAEMIEVLRNLVVNKGVQDVADRYVEALAGRGKLHAELAGLGKHFATKDVDLNVRLFVRSYGEALAACEKHVPASLKDCQIGLTLGSRAMGWKGLDEDAKAKTDARLALELATAANNAQRTDRTKNALEYLQDMLEDIL